MELEADCALWTTLPGEVAAEVRRRRSALLDRARGRVLDLDRAEDRRRLRVVSDLPAAAVAVDQHVDTILCTGALIDEPDLARALFAMARLLADDGELLLVEPVIRAGTLGLLVSTLGARQRAVRGLQLSRDVVATVRGAGLTVADLDRFEIPTPVWPLRRFVELRAIRVLGPARPGPADDRSGVRP